MHQIEQWVSGRHRLKGYGLGQYSVANVRVQASRLHQIDVGRQRILQVREESTEVEKVSTLIEVDKKIDVAFRAVFAGGDGTEDANVPASVQLREPQNLSALLVA